MEGIVNEHEVEFHEEMSNASSEASDNEFDDNQELGEIPEEAKEESKKPRAKPKKLTQEELRAQNQKALERFQKEHANSIAMVELHALQIQICNKTAEFIEKFRKDAPSDKQKVKVNKEIRIQRIKLETETRQALLDIARSKEAYITKDLARIAAYDATPARITAMNAKLTAKQQEIQKLERRLQELQVKLENASKPSKVRVPKDPSAEENKKTSRKPAQKQETPEEVLTELLTSETPIYPILTGKFCKHATRIVDLIFANINSYQADALNILVRNVSTVSLQIPKVCKDVGTMLNERQVVEMIISRIKVLIPE